MLLHKSEKWRWSGVEVRTVRWWCWCQVLGRILLLLWSFIERTIPETAGSQIEANNNAARRTIESMTGMDGFGWIYGYSLSKRCTKMFPKNGSPQSLEGHLVRSGKRATTDTLGGGRFPILSSTYSSASSSSCHWHYEYSWLPACLIVQKECGHLFIDHQIPLFVSIWAETDVTEGRNKNVDSCPICSTTGNRLKWISPKPVNWEVNESVRIARLKPRPAPLLPWRLSWDGERSSRPRIMIQWRLGYDQNIFILIPRPNREVFKYNLGKVEEKPRQVNPERVTQQEIISFVLF